MIINQNIYKMPKLVKRKQIIENYLEQGIKCITIIETLNQRKMHVMTDGTTIITDEIIQVLSKDVQIHSIKESWEYAIIDDMIEKSQGSLAKFDLLTILELNN